MSNFNVLKYLIIYLIIPIVLSKNLNDSFFQDNLLIIIIIGAIIIIIITVQHQANYQRLGCRGLAWQC